MCLSSSTGRLPSFDITIAPVNAIRSESVNLPPETPRSRGGSGDPVSKVVAVGPRSAGHHIDAFRSTDACRSRPCADSFVVYASAADSAIEVVWIELATHAIGSGPYAAPQTTRQFW